MLSRPQAMGTCHTQEAKATCGGCVVRAQCLAYAIEADEKYGIWGRPNRAERVRLRDAMQQGAGGEPGKGAA